VLASVPSEALTGLEGHPVDVEAALVQERRAGEGRETAATQRDQRVDDGVRIEVVAVGHQERPIADDGRGGARESAHGMGLANMRQRAESLPGASFSIISPAGGGTLLRLRFALEDS